jgi:PPOX class probable F420-dependent enzyme
VDEGEATMRLRAARVGRLATVTPEGSPHVVPLVFVIHERDGGLVAYWVVDEKPKRSRRLQRLRNIETNPSVAILVDEYTDDWGRLWWVRADGTGRVVRSRSEREAALDALRAKYPQYAIAPPAGPVVAVDIERVTGWTASDASPAVRRRKT